MFPALADIPEMHDRMITCVAKIIECALSYEGQNDSSAQSDPNHWVIILLRAPAPSSSKQKDHQRNGENRGYR